LFVAGALFNTDYLVEAIKATAAYRVVDVPALRVRLDHIATAFPQNQRKNVSQIEDVFIWPVLAALGWWSRFASKIGRSPGAMTCPMGCCLRTLRRRLASASSVRTLTEAVV
jgi:hypothetical protein